MIDIKRIEPVDLPGSLVFRLEKVYHESLRDFAMMIDKKNWIMYINASVPEEDVQRIVEYIYYPGNDVNVKKEDFVDYVFEHYGQAAFYEMVDGHKHLRGQERDKKAEKLAEMAIPLIEKEIKSENPVVDFDERLLYKVYSAGSDTKQKTLENIVGYGNVYLFYLGYLMGAGVIKD